MLVGNLRYKYVAFVKCSQWLKIFYYIRLTFTSAHSSYAFVFFVENSAIFIGWLEPFLIMFKNGKNLLYNHSFVFLKQVEPLSIRYYFVNVTFLMTSRYFKLSLVFYFIFHNLFENINRKKMIEDPFHFMDTTAFFISIILPAFSLIKDRYFQISVILVPVANRKKWGFLTKSMQALSLSTSTLLPSDIRNLLLLNCGKWFLSNKFY